jgi:lipid-binding SYLF domain-containing protein
MKRRFCTKIITVLLVLLAVAAPLASAASAEEKRQQVRNMAEKTLSRLYEVHPSARGAVESAMGYAVFSNYGVKIFVLGGGRGKGMAVNNETGEEIFMKMAQVDVGLGLGVKDFSVIFVFETEKAFNKFINQGWEFGGQATVAATDSVTGGSLQGAVSIWPGAYMYQLTDRGLAVELTGKGTRYYKDSELN